MKITAYLELADELLLVGNAYTGFRQGKLSGTFSYSDTYINHATAYAIDPSLSLTSGPWPLPRGLPRAFTDSAPDRWGRSLIMKKLTTQTGHIPNLDDRDFLLRVSDDTRQGALRFKVEGKKEFQSPDSYVPPLFSLPKLMHAAEEVTKDNALLAHQAIKMLLDAGSGSLGGARPKASVDNNGQLAIAKFPHHHDDWDVITWEKIALDLAKNAGINTPVSSLVNIDDKAVLVIDRFDREQNRRIGYMSAMTMIEARDGESHDYFDLVDVLPDNLVNTTDNLKELFRRIIFSIAINNTDDHLRNHGFLRRQEGWELSPVFDINPNPVQNSQRQTTILGEISPEKELVALMNNCDSFGLSKDNAKVIIRKVSEAVSDWIKVANNFGIKKGEQKLFEPMFSRRLELLKTHICQEQP
ncbi:MAG: type II toxin-antitoxin system HipA family toxin [Micrococcaceae bacterium]